MTTPRIYSAHNFTVRQLKIMRQNINPISIINLSCNNGGINSSDKDSNVTKGPNSAAELGSPTCNWLPKPAYIGHTVNVMPSFSQQFCVLTSIETLKEIQRFARKHEERLHHHPNVEAMQLLQQRTAKMAQKNQALLSWQINS
jgi:hypothetical protein